MKSISKYCSLDNCSNLIKSKGLCQKHYMRLWFRSNYYSTWKNAKSRIYNPLARGYPDYGGRGIKMCIRWKSSYKAFEIDMGEKPTSKDTLDRIDVDGNYSCGKCEECTSNNWPMNCRWASPSIQNYNRRKMPQNSSGYRGVTYNQKSKKWVAQLRLNRRLYYMGAYQYIEEAAVAYDRAAIFFYAENAITNLL